MAGWRNLDGTPEAQGVSESTLPPTLEVARV